MADDADRAQKDADILEEAQAAEIRRKVETMPKGVPGVCRLCGEDMPRLVNGACAPCRDLHKLP